MKSPEIATSTDRSQPMVPRGRADTKDHTKNEQTRKQQAHRPALIQRKMIQLRNMIQCNNFRTSRTETETINHQVKK